MFASDRADPLLPELADSFADRREDLFNRLPNLRCLEQVLKRPNHPQLVDLNSSTNQVGTPASEFFFREAPYGWTWPTPRLSALGCSASTGRQEFISTCLRNGTDRSAVRHQTSYFLKHGKVIVCVEPVPPLRPLWTQQVVPALPTPE